MMFSNKKLTKRDKITIISLLVVIFTAAAVVIGMVAAKYVTQVRLPGAINVSADLASKVIVYEHEAGRTSDGDYTLGENTTDNNKYVLMPGVDIPKDPTVRIKDYTGLTAWVYVEVIETNFPADITVDGTTVKPLTYTIDEENWHQLKNEDNTAVTINGHPVYYREVTKEDMTADSADVDLKILNPEKMIVSQWISREGDSAVNAQLSFQAYLAKKTDSAYNDFQQFMPAAPANPDDGN